MALIGKIRGKSWLLVVMVGLGLGGFIIMDMTSGQQSIFGSQQGLMADIDGRELSINEFTRTEQLLYSGGGGNTFSQRDYLWNYFLDETVVGNEAAELGMGISKEELMELQFGPNGIISPVIEGRFRDQNTFQVDRTRLNGFKEAIEKDEMTDPGIRSFWAHQEKEIQTERLKDKLNTMVAKALYAPTWMVNMYNSAQYNEVKFSYVQVPLDEIENSDVTLSDADFNAYLNENKAQFAQDEELRRLEYLTFTVEPTAVDTATLLKRITEVAMEFKTTDNDTVFIESNYGTFDPTFYKSTALPDPSLKDTLANMAVGDVYGPYIKDNEYRVVKLLGTKAIPDSVRARHILIKPAAENQNAYLQAARTVDSLKNLIDAGTETFEALATTFGTDATASKGGDLGFTAPGAMVKPFNDLIFFRAEPNELNTVITQFGVHLVEVTDRKYLTNEESIQLGTITEAIIPSQKTQDELYRQALDFVSKNQQYEDLVTAAAANDKLELQEAPALTENAYSVGALGPEQASRDMIRWAFSSNAEVGGVSPTVYSYQDKVKYYTNKFIIVALKSIQDPGTAKVADVRTQIEQKVINGKKGQEIYESIKGKTMQAVASQYSTSVDTAQSVTFDAGFIPGLGNEPKVIAAAFSLNAGQVSAPIVGENGVYIITVLDRPKDVTPANVAQLRKSLTGTLASQINANLAKELRKGADIEDNRSKFY